MFVNGRSLLLKVDSRPLSTATVLKAALQEVGDSWAFVSTAPTKTLLGRLSKGCRVPIRPDEVVPAFTFREAVEYQETALPATACFYCGRSRKAATKIQADHATPVARGGADTDSNKVAACQRCNQAKFDRSYEGFRRDVARRRRSDALPTFFGELQRARRFLWYSFVPDGSSAVPYSTKELGL